MSITVKAIGLGYYGLKRRKIGDVFEIEHEKDFSKKWMKKTKEEPVDAADASLGDVAKKKKSKSKSKSRSKAKAAKKADGKAAEKAAKDEGDRGSEF